jgi:cytochrome oxidase Cu insertion factor (SCO1/SenC/PrrC family)
MKRFVAFSIFALLVTACSDKNVFKIEGNLGNHEKGHIYLNRLDVDISVRIDSAKIRNNGTFKFKVKASEPNFFQVGFSDSDFITLLAEPGEKIKLIFKGKYLYDDYEIHGSPGSEKIKVLDIVLANSKRKIDSLRTIYEQVLNKPDYNEKEKIIDDEFVRILKEQRKNNIEFILKNLNSFASIKALYQKIDDNTYVLFDTRDLQFFKLVSDTLIYHYPNSKQAQALKKNFEKELNKMVINKIDQLAKNIPATTLDPDLKDLNGKRIALSSLKGKYVLLTFWSAASEDCIAENLELKQLYRTYSKKGFEIYQINLDPDMETWKNAVKFDELPWISVREDDPNKPVTANIYNVKSLPTNYLYDKTGNIIASNIHDKNLQLKLNQVFGN